MYAFMKGMGFDGVHIGGHGMKVDDALFIIEKGEELLPNWQDEVAKFDFPQKGGFYYFNKDEKTGLNTDEEAPRTSRPVVPLNYKFSRLMHNVCFEPKGALFGLMTGMSKSADKGGFFRFMEHMSKVALFECMDCGDCALTDVAYVCPMSQCPKNQRTAPAAAVSKAGVKSILTRKNASGFRLMTVSKITTKRVKLKTTWSRRRIGISSTPLPGRIIS
jgi:methylenetetrahydrofolate reductase (NADPH)